MFSDSDDSQISQPHLIQILKKKTSTINLKKLDNNSCTSQVLQTCEKVINLQTKAIKQEDILKQFSNNIEDEEESTDAEFNFSESSSLERFDEDCIEKNKLKIKEKKLSEQILLDFLNKNDQVIEDEDKDKFYQDKSIQTSLKSLLNQNINDLNLKKCIQNSIISDSNDKNLEILDSPLNSPTASSFHSKHLKKWFNTHHLEYKNNYFFADEEKKSIQEENCFQNRQIGIFNFTFDEELFYKVKKFFPNVSTNRIRMFMIKYNNQEHDVIAATIDSLSPIRKKQYLKNKTTLDRTLVNYLKNNEKYSFDSSFKNDEKKTKIENQYNHPKVEIKLKYLKLLYPDVDELKLFYLLHNYDLKANIVAKKLEESGYIRIDPENQSRRSSIKVCYDKKIMPELNLTFDEQQERCDKLKQLYSNIDIQLIKLALQCTKFDLEVAKKILNETDLNDFEKLKKPLNQKSLDESIYIYKCDRGVQTFNLSYFEFGGFYKIKRTEKVTIVECNFKSTWTGEDDMEKKVEIKLSVGANPLNHKGSKKFEKKTKIQTKGADPKNCLGPNPQHLKGRELCNVKGCKELKNLKTSNKIKCKGHNLVLVEGTIRQKKSKNYFYYDENFKSVHDEILKNLCEQKITSIA